MAATVEDAVAMNRLIHKAVRRDLGRFDAALGAFTAGDRERATALADLFARFDEMVTVHHVGEDTHLWPLFSGTPDDRVAVAELSAEHEQMVRSLTAAQAAVTRLGSSASGPDAVAARSTVGELSRDVDTHFAHEERDMEGLISRAEPDALRSAFRRLDREGGFVQGLWFMQWVADGTTSEERAFLERVVPAPFRWLSNRFAQRKYANATAAVLVG